MNNVFHRINENITTITIKNNTIQFRTHVHIFMDNLLKIKLGFVKAPYNKE